MNDLKLPGFQLAQHRTHRHGECSCCHRMFLSELQEFSQLTKQKRNKLSSLTRTENLQQFYQDSSIYSKLFCLVDYLLLIQYYYRRRPKRTILPGASSFIIQVKLTTFFSQEIHDFCHCGFIEVDHFRD